MGVNNIHLTLTPCRHETRLLKETRSLVDSKIVDRVLIIALHEEGLAETETLDEARSVIRVRLRTSKLHKVFQPIKYVELTWKVIRYARRFDSRLINVHSLDLLPLGVLIKCLSRGDLVYDAHELETEISGSSGGRAMLARIVERVLIRFVDLTIVVSGGIQSHYERAYPALPIVTVMNCPPFSISTRTSILRDALKIPRDSTVYLYQGGLGYGRGIELILRTFADMCDRKKVVVFMGYGQLEDKIKKAAAESNNVYFLPAVAPEAVLEYTASADVGLALIENTSLSYYHCLPNKLFEYIMAGVPVIVSNLPEMNAIVTRSGVGVVMHGHDVADLHAAAESLASMSHAALRENILQTAREYSWASQEGAMIAAYRVHVKSAKTTPQISRVVT